MSMTGRWGQVALPLLLLLAFAITGCIRITVEPEAAAGAAPAETEARELDGPDLAVTAIDFDPPLRDGSTVAADHLVLLVVVENRGRTAADKVLVEARLLDGQNSAQLDVSTATIDRIVAGESRVVRFGGLPTLPLRSAYALRIAIPAVTGEQITSNNQRTFYLRVDAAGR